MEVKSSRTVYERLGKTSYRQARGSGSGYANKVCSYWLVGKCTRNPCRFLHPTVPLSQPSKQAHLSVSRPPLKKMPHKQASTWRRSPDDFTNIITAPTTEGVKSNSVSAKQSSVMPNKTPGSTTKEVKSYSVSAKQSSVTPNKTPGPTTEEVKSDSVSAKQSSVTPNKTQGPITEEVKSEAKSKTFEKAQIKVCENWLSGTCVNGELCEYLHSWCSGNGFSMLAKLEGHTKAVTGITLPSGSDKLYTCSGDGTIRCWDCNTGECKSLEFLSDEAGCLVSEGQRLYLGLENVVKACDLKAGKQLTLTGPIGQVNAMIADEDMLYAGAQDGTIWAWRFSPEFSSVELVATLKGHVQGVASFTLGCCNRLYSGSKDNTVRVWDLDSFQCIQTLQGHMGEVTSLLCWNQCLLSCSLDGTIKAWGQSISGEIELFHTYGEDNGGCLALCGIEDAESKPILLCSLEDNTVRLYDLPLFTERGRIFSKREVRSVQSGPQGLFFTGDATGRVTVWRLDGVCT